MGNALRSSSLDSVSKEKILTALQQALPSVSEMLKEHIEWALTQINAASK
jgi:hypothetical protein